MENGIHIINICYGNIWRVAKKSFQDAKQHLSPTRYTTYKSVTYVGSYIISAYMYRTKKRNSVIIAEKKRLNGYFAFHS